MTTREEFERTVERLARELIAKGLLIEAGFMVFRKHFMSPEASAGQMAHARFAFFAGAQHLWGSIHGALDEDAEPTEADMDRMSKINDELQRFYVEMHQREKPKGRA